MPCKCTTLRRDVHVDVKKIIINAGARYLLAKYVDELAITSRFNFVSKAKNLQTNVCLKLPEEASYGGTSLTLSIVSVLMSTGNWRGSK